MNNSESDFNFEDIKLYDILESDDTAPRFCKFSFIKKNDNSNLDSMVVLINEQNNYKFYVVKFTDKPIFDPNGNSTTLKNPIYKSIDNKVWIMGSPHGNNEYGISYIKRLKGISDVIETNIFRKIDKIISKDKFSELILFCSKDKDEVIRCRNLTYKYIEETFKDFL